mmetsp:Transcript_5519/g.15964  ORF Transcript_5519/g.15964 Transcript_5519/m.15964 type:complete len:305 (+) Transcript_5519:318-1232(+)|eukprot:CAMPEP_0172363162 /NCGR_PEP_ID=MMETSP1060-20121228/6601_1 /TAXON_ID=37318 /ORGANISM="Pseudo-nitzschia pungens, Strain cf. cingulata" /LENGTH=304 /DNA_ID=CAMNT_0013085843 /DNA_START=301 /DNA_END=1215 /DNA_ORIENTATION=+
MTDSFLQSMTFSRAREFLYACDCEECEDIPLSIRKFIHDRKRQRKESGPIKRTQQQTLVSKRGPITLHSIYMPKHAEPLIDFGNSHRVVWVKRLIKHRSKQDEGTNGEQSSQKGKSVLQWIGKGIIGSSHEEKCRVNLCDWTEGSVIFIPSTGGKAVGWIHTNDKNAADTNSNDDDDDDDSTRTTKTETDTKATNNKTHQSDNFAILYVAKIPSSAITKTQEESEKNNREWFDAIIDCCRDGLEFCTKESSNDPSYHKFTSDASELVKKAIREVDEDGESRDATVEPASKRVRWKQPEAKPESR